MARTARALAADGWNAIALDMPGHGGTIWLDGLDDRERYARANVARLVGEAVGTLGSRPVLIGHSWGADTALAIIVSGRALEHVVLIDPPVMGADVAGELAIEDVAELRPGDLDAARAVVATRRWMTDPLDAEAKAQALTTIAPGSIEAVYLADGAWQPRVDARRWRVLPDAPPLDLIASDPDFGGLIPLPALDELRSILGEEHVHFLEGASHSPQRTDFDRLWPLLARSSARRPWLAQRSTTLVERLVLCRWPVPRVVDGHAARHEGGPARPVAPGGDRADGGVEQGSRLGGPKTKPLPSGSGVRVEDRIGEAARPPHDRHGPVAQRDHLALSAGLETRGHQEYIRPGVDPPRLVAVEAIDATIRSGSRFARALRPLTRP